MSDNNNNNNINSNSNNNNNNNNSNNNNSNVSNKIEDKKEEAQLCLRNCGFYGNPKTNGLCSSCYNKDSNSTLRQQLQQQINNNNTNNNNNNNTNNNNNINNNNNNIINNTNSSNINENSCNNSKDESPKSNKKRTLDYLDYSLGGMNGVGNNNTFREGLESTSAPSVLLSSSPNPSSLTTTTTATGGGTNPQSSPLKILKGEESQPKQQQASSLTSPLSSSPLSSSPSKSNIKCKFMGCGKPIGIMQSMSNKCRCGEHYCGKHIHNHNCTFDYKGLAKTTIAKANPQILANKIVKL
ncbi:hypothetical protein RB653_007740 [Dictyostelium firmibasis]|uniref:A20-type domain-containing protein n=1 Tax=Dictyostelium firmibasis TaxID=79012 RepID=A0AAN7TV24_9MYCE